MVIRGRHNRQRVARWRWERRPSGPSKLEFHRSYRIYRIYDLRDATLGLLKYAVRDGISIKSGFDSAYPLRNGRRRLPREASQDIASHRSLVNSAKIRDMEACKVAETTLWYCCFPTEPLVQHNIILTLSYIFLYNIILHVLFYFLLVLPVEATFFSNYRCQWLHWSNGTITWMPWKMAQTNLRQSPSSRAQAALDLFLIEQLNLLEFVRFYSIPFDPKLIRGCSNGTSPMPLHCTPISPLSRE